MAQRDEGFFSAQDGLRLFRESVSPDGVPKAHVGVVHGYADHCGRYRGVIDALVQDGYAVHAFDYRGHGQADGRRGHVDAFGEYVSDLELFWDRIREAAGPRKRFVLAHSNGGLITLKWLTGQPKGVDGAILSSPYLALALEPPRLQVFASKLIGSLLPWLPFKLPLKPEQLTRDEKAQEAVRKDALYNLVVTPGYFTEVQKAQAEVLQAGASVQLPLFYFCGTADPVVSTPASREFFPTLGAKDKTFKEYPDRVHECMNDVGKEEVWRDISSWISKHL